MLELLKNVSLLLVVDMDDEEITVWTFDDRALHTGISSGHVESCVHLFFVCFRTCFL